jgi:hypothetical protein
VTESAADLEPALTVEALTNGETAAAPAPGAAPAAPAGATAKSALPREFQGLKFPTDGVLTRQWMEFLSQVSTK